jgi:tRNA nucleotidyltransferase (CCA-adding enzyme)
LSYSATAQISQGLKEWTSQLNPTKDEQKDMKATMQAVSSVLQAICKNKTWTVQVLPVGSNKKKTSLRGS